MAQVVKHLSAVQETHLQSLGWKDNLGEGMATHFTILAWTLADREGESTLLSQSGEEKGLR